MKEKALVALKASIEKWEIRAAGDHTAKLGPRECPLCIIYSSKPDLCDNCLGCPVFEKTEERYCNGTPYYKYAGDRTDANAKEEVAFLKSLLPVEVVPLAVPLAAKEEFKWKDLDYLGKKEKDLWT